MIPLWKWIRSIYHEDSYIWVDVLLLKETQKAMLVLFNDQKTWIPKKVWIIEMRPRRHCEKARSADEAISIKISEYHLAQRFQ